MRQHLTEREEREKEGKQVQEMWTAGKKGKLEVSCEWKERQEGSKDSGNKEWKVEKPFQRNCSIQDKKKLRKKSHN